MKTPELKPARLQPPNAMAARLSRFTRPAMIMVGPGRYVPADNKSGAPDYTLCTWTRNADGTYAPQPDQTRFFRLTEALVRRLGFHERPDTILRLGRAGFVEVVKVAPGTHLLNLDSWWNHVRRCAEDPEFWDDDARLAEYRKAL